jgi:hypothetical protein
MSNLRILGTTLALVLVAQVVPFAGAAEQASVAALMQKDIAEMPDKEMVMISVTYPPGSSAEEEGRRDSFAR